MTEGDWDIPEVCDDCEECPKTCGCDPDDCLEQKHICWLEDTRDSHD